MDFLNQFGIYRGKDEFSRGRRAILSSTILSSIISQLTNGIFYTGFLAAYGFDVVNIGIVALAPYISIVFTLLSPYFLQHFKKRKKLLGFSKLISYTIQIALFTLVPSIFHDTSSRVIAISVIIALANIFSGLTDSGYTTWYSYFLTENVRPAYLITSQFLCNIIPFSVVMLFSIGSDLLAGTDYQLLYLTLLRWFAYLVAIADVIIRMRPQEYEQKEISRPRLTDIIRIPLSDKNWRKIMLVSAAWMFTSTATSSCLTVYLLEDVGISYTFNNTINILYSVAFPLFSGFWRKRIMRTSWLSVYAVTLGGYAVMQIAYSFVNAGNYIWLMLIVRLTQHIVGVGQNTSNANLQYICLPDTNRTCYIALYTLLNNISGMIGLALGTLFCAKTLGMHFPVCGYPMPPVPFLLLITGVLQILLALYVKYLSKDPVFSSKK